MYKLPYGNQYLDFTLPEASDVSVLESTEINAEQPESQLVAEALADPLGQDLPKDIGSEEEIAIVISDLTRPVPNKVILPPLLNRLVDRGAKQEKITIVVGTGKHRVHNREDFIELVGAEIVNKYNVVSHDGEDKDSHTYLGETSRGTPLYIDSRFAEADIKIVTGMLDPHQFVGFSGGMKGVTIGLGYEETIETNHSQMFKDKAQLGDKDQNPVRQDVNELREFLEVEFCINVILDDHNEIIKVLAGDEEEVFKQGVEFINYKAVAETDQPVDIAIASPGGYPKDINLYQAQKALFHAAEIVKEGGTIVLAAECIEGIGSSAFEEWMQAGETPAEVLTNFKQAGFQLEAHKAYLFSSSLVKADLFLVSDGLEEELASTFKLKLFSSLEQAIEKAIAKYGQESKIAVLPKASSLIPQIKN